MACRIVMALPAVVGAALASATPANTVMAAVNAGLCTDGDASCTPSTSSSSFVSTDKSSEVWLLQLAVGRTDAARMNLSSQKSPEEPDAAEEQEINGTRAIDVAKVWEKLKVAVQVDKLEAAFQGLSESNLTERAQQKLNKVWKSLPSVEQIKQRFSDQWANISKAAEIEDLNVSLLEMKSDSAKAGELRQRLHDLQEPLSNDTVTDVRGQVEDMFGEMQDTDPAFPDLDKLMASIEDFTANTDDALKQLVRVMEQAQNMGAHAEIVAKTLAGTMKNSMEAVHGLVGDMQAGAPDQNVVVKQLVSTVKNSMHALNDLVGDILPAGPDEEDEEDEEEEYSQRRALEDGYSQRRGMAPEDEQSQRKGLAPDEDSQARASDGVPE